MLNITYEYKLKPTLEQEAVIEDWLAICRKVYNYAQMRSSSGNPELS